MTTPETLLAVVHHAAHVEHVGAQGSPYAETLRALLDGRDGWEARTEYRLEWRAVPSREWRQVALPLSMSREDLLGTLVRANSSATGEYRVVDTDVVVLRSVPRVVQPEQAAPLAGGDASPPAPGVPVEWRIEWTGPDWEGWKHYQYVDPYDVERMRAWVDSENAAVQAWAKKKHGGESRVRYRMAFRLLLEPESSPWLPEQTQVDP